MEKRDFDEAVQDAHRYQEEETLWEALRREAKGLSFGDFPAALLFFGVIIFGMMIL